MVNATAGGPTWTDIMTAFGTVGAVMAALGIALWTEWRAGKRIREEHERSDRLLSQERERAASELAQQREHEQTALAEERRLTLGREQLAEAYAVQVVSAERVTDKTKARSTPYITKRIAVIVVNRGSYTITRVEARFWISGHAMGHRTFDRWSGFQALPEALREGWTRAPEHGMYGVLAPWDGGFRFESDDTESWQLENPVPIVRWIDRWGTHWEHKRGEVRQVEDGDPWEP
jgi:hypothetical protein